MKLLLDENLSRRIVPALQDRFPGSSQITLLNLEKSNDLDVWGFAKANDFIIVSRDDDFRQLLQVFGFPPKIILLNMGDCSNQKVLDALIGADGLIEQLEDTEVGIVELY
ncbi:MAG: DUF5615 family PIN-like protein [Spongiibacteraceae bacterium]